VVIPVLYYVTYRRRFSHTRGGSAP
jgi:hypothetical protein